jgi:hypothetical protein
MTTISPFVTVNGITMRLKVFIEACAESGKYRITQVRSKRDLSAWNTGPTAESSNGAYHVEMLEGGRTWIDGGVYQFWMRNDGMGHSAEYFETIEEYSAYKPNNNAPDAIAREIGLCANYEMGL